MKRYVAVLLLLVAACAAAGYAQQGGKFGLGAVFGDPTGLAWKYKLEQSRSLAGSIGFSPNTKFRFQADYIWQSYPFSEKNLSIHYGPGVTFGVAKTSSAVFSDGGGNGDAGFGIRGVVGVTYVIKNSPLDIFFEVAPLIVFAPTTNTGVDVGFGLRAYP